ncbi:homocysteine S-methyltransferase [Limosilactobacillus equigenerosi]|uniref:S-methylmethionine:homocysteine methyltransferase n=1 Tax=Limosilactobacillus equigenerosi DSM 18793 = JCM 14505 TaxID=1423742 RepID=A0A0R1UXR2_9LACO|nr:homocysteine S-methyltransferase [Limosilactobacillus equigenerosi]KRL96314.1 homocysteine methyltransferase [Limosilactobacillus equigenerosi DSM 18793 = JCM 14505]
MNLLTRLQQGPLVLDGAMSTPLEHYGLDTNNQLWTAMALVKDPQKVYQVHLDYFNAGADLVITNTYQANLPAFLTAGFTETQARQFIRHAVELANQARDDYEVKTGKHNYVAGTIGPYGAYLADGSEYTGNYELSVDEYQAFHRPRLEEILAAGIDVLAVETQPKLTETQAVLELVHQLAPDLPVYVAFSLHDDHHLADGTALATAVQAIATDSQVVAVGFNCVALDVVEPAIQLIHATTDLPIIVYPNSGATYDPTTKTWSDPASGPTFKELIPTWYHAGATIIGGCCTTMPHDIENVRAYFDTLE